MIELLFKRSIPEKERKLKSKKRDVKMLTLRGHFEIKKLRKDPKVTAIGNIIMIKRYWLPKPILMR